MGNAVNSRAKNLGPPEHETDQIFLLSVTSWQLRSRRRLDAKLYIILPSKLIVPSSKQRRTARTRGILPWPEQSHIWEI